MHSRWCIRAIACSVLLALIVLASSGNVRWAVFTLILGFAIPAGAVVIHTSSDADPDVWPDVADESTHDDRDPAASGVWPSWANLLPGDDPGAEPDSWAPRSVVSLVRGVPREDAIALHPHRSSIHAAALARRWTDPSSRRMLIAPPLRVRGFSRPCLDQPADGHGVRVAAAAGIDNKRESGIDRDGDESAGERTTAPTPTIMPLASDCPGIEIAAYAFPRLAECMLAPDTLPVGLGLCFLDMTLVPMSQLPRYIFTARVALDTYRAHCNVASAWTSLTTSSDHAAAAAAGAPSAAAVAAAGSGGGGSGGGEAEVVVTLGRAYLLRYPVAEPCPIRDGFGDGVASVIVDTLGRDPEGDASPPPPGSVAFVCRQSLALVPILSPCQCPGNAARLLASHCRHPQECSSTRSPGLLPVLRSEVYQHDGTALDGAVPVVVWYTVPTFACVLPFNATTSTPPRRAAVALDEGQPMEDEEMEDEEREDEERVDEEEEKVEEVDVRSQHAQPKEQQPSVQPDAPSSPLLVADDPASGS